MIPERPLVLFVAGINRSGTTLLDASLAEPGPMVSVGELHYLWRGLVDGWNCGCGEPLRECSMWKDVREEAIGDAGPARWRQLDAIQRSQVRSRPIRLLRLRRRLNADPPRGAAQEGLTDYRDTLERVYLAIGYVTGADVIVDSSKGPHDAAVLASIDQIPAAAVHLVRDSRAVAYSWTLKVSNPTLPGGYLEQARPVVTAGRWMAWNTAIESVTRRAFDPRFLMLRYEDLCADPRSSIARVYEMIGRPDIVPAVNAEKEIDLTRGHAIAGDPRLAGRGRIRIEAMSRWEEGMGASSRTAVTAITLPMLQRYGYATGTNGTRSTG